MHRTPWSTCVAVCAILLVAAVARAQSNVHAVRIQAVGGFLGQLEGFCEDKGGPYDWGTANPAKCMGAHEGAGWLGGALGAIRTVTPKDDADPFDIVAITANNQPVTSESQFYSYLRMLKPTVIGLGKEDFDRRIRNAGSAKNIADVLTSNADLPFLASNVTIRQSAHDLNTEKSGPFTLHITKDASVDWTKPIVVEYPGPHPPGIRLRSYDSCPVNARPMTDGRSEVAKLPKEKTGKDAPLDITGGLRPGRCYRLDLSEQPDRPDTFWITTDALLTPRHHSLKAYDGLPLIATPDGDLVIVNAVDPAARLQAATSAWKWQDGNVEKEMLVVSPGDYLASLFAAIAPAADQNAPRKAQPMVVLLASATDATTLEVLGRFPQIRFVILDPESNLLARAAPETTAAPIYGGDRGFASIVDPVYHSATKVFLRPEWFGETLVTATAQLHTLTPDWMMESPDVKVNVIAGLEFAWRTGSEVIYEAVASGSRMEIGRGIPYVDCPKTDAPTTRCKDFESIWSTRPSVAAMLGDAIRQKARADLAVISASIVDEDFQPWVNRMITDSKHDATWLSKYILVRAVYAAPRMVRTYVSGNDLPSLIGKIMMRDIDNCISGLGGLCPPVDADHPSDVNVNGRRVDRRLFYSIVMSDALAEQLSLSHDEDDASVLDPLTVADEYLKRGDWYAAQGVERRGNGRHSAYLALNTAAFGWSKVVVTDPGKDGSVETSAIRANLRQLDYAGATSSQMMTLAIDADFAPWDQASYAVRVPVTFNYSQKKQGDSTSYDNDQLSYGARYDKKLHALSELRIFGGAFVDGPLQALKNSLTPTRVVSPDGAAITVTESASKATPFVFEPSRFIHGAVGAEVTGYRDLPMGNVTLQPTVLGVRWAYGKETRIPTAVTLGDDPLNFVLFTQAGLNAALNEYFKNHPSSFPQGVRVEVEDAARFAHRPQVDAQGTIVITGKKTYTTDVAVQLRWYRYPDKDANLFALTFTQKYDVKFTTPLVKRFNLVPHLIYQSANVTTGVTKPFKYFSFDIGVSLPLVKRWGQGRLFQ